MSDYDEAAIQRVLARFSRGWPAALECSEGWYPLIIETDAKLSALDPNYTIEQIKEKFGGLRYYFSFSDDVSDEARAAGWDIEEESERKSFEICEYCGEPGKPRSGGWVKTLCDAHANGREPMDIKKEWG